MATILVIDDDIDFCETMQSLITRMAHTCIAVHTLKDGLKTLASEQIDLLLLDVRLPDGNGIERLPAIREAGDSSPEIFIVTGIGDPDGAEIAIREGVWDYIIKPTKINEIRLCLNRALTYREEKQKKQKPVQLNLSRIVGNSSQIRNCFESLAQAANSAVPVLISGETGTGKELFASTIHENSIRSTNGFIVLDCASLTETLLESTLFGHKRGAFTGADQQKTGLITLAHNGTLFLDEVGEMPLSTQKTFLRVLQEKKYRPIGETTELSSDFRVIAATNQNLHEMVDRGEFRKDLLFRLCAIQMNIPPLRLRQSDIIPLTVFHISRLCEENSIPGKGFEKGFMDTLEAYDWPGNIRELFHVVEMAFIASGQENTLYPMHLPKEIRIRVTKSQIGNGLIKNQPESGELANGDGSYPTLKEHKQSMEIEYLSQVIKDCNGDLNKILNRSGLSKSHYYGLMKKYGIRI